MRGMKILWFFGAVIVLLLIIDGFMLGSTDLPKESPTMFPRFVTRDIKGNTVTDGIFVGKTTVLCLYTTKDENSMEVMVKLSRLNLPKNTQIVGLVGDVKDDAEPPGKLKDLDLDDNVSQLMVNDNFLPFLATVHAVPVIYFVNAEGNIVGQPVLGNNIPLVENELARIREFGSPRNHALKYIHEYILYKT